MLDSKASLKLIRKYGIKNSALYIVESKSKAVKTAKKLKFPVVMKLASERVIHKTDVGAIKLGLRDVKSVDEAFDFFKKHFPKEKVALQKTISGLEVIIGGKRDPQFGPTVVFGLGGIFVEAIKDVSLRVAPLTRKDAKDMLDEISASEILKGARGKKYATTKLIDMILKVSQLMVKEKKIKELDLNPVIINEKDAVAVDVRVIV